MITNSMQTLSPYLANSQKVFRQQLEKSMAENQALNTTKDGATIQPVPTKDPVTIQPVPSEEVKPYIPVPNEEQLSDEYFAKQQLEANIQERRDHARQAAVYAAELKQTQENIDTYVNASSDSDDTLFEGVCGCGCGCVLLSELHLRRIDCVRLRVPIVSDGLSM